MNKRRFLVAGALRAVVVPSVAAGASSARTGPGVRKTIFAQL